MAFKTYFLATRPWSFPVSVMPVLVTTAGLFSMGYPVSWGMSLWAIVGIVLFHAAANALSDFYDYRRGVDAADTYGSRTLVDGAMTDRQMLRYAYVLFALAVLNGLAIAWVSSWNLLWIGAIGGLTAFFYSVLKFRALGDVDIFLNFGLLPALGTAMVVVPDSSCCAVYTDALWLVLAYVPITNAVLHANNTRDIATDTRARIHTVPMLIGVRASQIIYYIEVLLPVLWVVVCIIFGKLPWGALLIALSLPVAWRNCRTMARLSTDKDAINHLDEQTAQQQLISSFLLIVGIMGSVGFVRFFG